MWLQIVRGLFGVMLILAVCTVEAAEKKKKAKPAPVPAAPVAPAPPAKSAADLAQEQLQNAWAGRLDGAWSLELRPATPEQGKPQNDTLTFAGRRMESDMLTQQGAGGSNFTLTPQDEHAAVWETMQITPEGDRVLWRGEVRDSNMSGTLIRQPQEGEASMWSFTGTKGPTTTPDVSDKALTP